MKKLPPIQKILEAYTAIVDNNVNLTENEAKVKSSNGAKTYTVSWENDVYHSNDNATYWQGYAGYPVIAVLMLQGKLPDVYKRQYQCGLILCPLKDQFER